MDVIEAGDVVEKPSPDVFRSSRQYLDSEVRLIEQIKRNFLDTVGCMEFRKFSRRHQGVFRDVARLWTLVLLVLCGFFSNLLLFSSCPNLGDIAAQGLFHKGYNLVILCVEIVMIVITSFWLLATQFQTGVVYSFRLSVIYAAITFLLFILRTTISDSHGSIFLQKCDYILSNGEVIVYNIIPLAYISLQFCISLVSFFYSKLRPIIAVYYFKHPWFLKSWKFVNIEPVELKLLSFGKKFEGCRNNSPKSGACSKSGGVSGSSEGVKEGWGGDSGDARMFWKTESDNENIRLASGYFIEIKRFSVRKLLKKLNPIRLDLLLTFRTRKDRARRPNSLKNQGCSITSWYLGEINEEGRPHGFGRWREDDYYGEILVGFWKNGHPVGPFKTRECRSGSGFICLKLGFCRTEASPTPNLYGYADIECSVSGQFFRGFPLCHIYPAPAIGVQRSGSIFARLGAKGRAALDDTTQKGKKMVGAVFNSSWIRGRREEGEEKRPPTEKAASADPRKVVRLNTDKADENLDSPDLNNLSVEIPSSCEPQSSKEEQARLSGSCKSEMNLGFQKGVHMIRKVRQKLRRNQNRQEKERDISLLWVFQNLSPHIPMFTIHPKNEVTILVDAERGLYIAGYFPVSEVLRYTKQTGARLALSDEDPDCLLSENNLKSTILSPSDATISGLIPFSSSFSTSTIVKASQYPLNRSQDNRYLESVEVRVVDRYRHDSMYSAKEGFDDEEANDNTVYYPELEVKNWIHSDGLHAAEALIFIHGYNNTIVDALRQVGQMVAFGNFPSYIKPMVFSWPSGNSFLEYFKARKSAESPHTHNSLYQLILGLRNRGIRHIHIMTHSMGTRLFIQSFPKLLLENLLERCEQHDHRSSIDPGNYLGIRHSGTQLGEDTINPMANEKVQIVSMTFLNPDYYLDDFINKAFPMLRQYCNLITMYGDSQDGALKWSEIIQGRKALGCNVFGLHYGASGSFGKKAKSQINDLDQYRGSDVELTVGLHKGGAAAPAPAASPSNMGAYEDGINVSSAQRGGGSRASDENYPSQENANRRQRGGNESALSLIYPSKVLINSFNASQSPRQHSPKGSSSGILDTSSSYANKYSPEQRFNYLDMDVIDQSFIEQNVGTMRHNNWNLNREVIEDLRELVVSRKRAYQRSTRLDKREGNVWVYRIAPSCVTSIFD